MKYCPHCGMPLEDGARYCVRCGGNAESSAAQTLQNRKAFVRNLIRISALVVAVFFFFPFVTISCGTNDLFGLPDLGPSDETPGEAENDFSQIMTGLDMAVLSLSPGAAGENIGGGIHIMLILAIPAAVCVLPFFKGVGRYYIPISLIGAAGCLYLLISLNIGGFGRIPMGYDMFLIKMLYGYWICLAGAFFMLFFSLCALYLQKRGSYAKVEGPAGPPQASSPPQSGGPPPTEGGGYRRKVASAAPEERGGSDAR